MSKSFWLKYIEKENRIKSKLQIPSGAQMAMNWSMANAKVLEQEGEQVRPAQEEEEEVKFEKSSKNMERVVLQSE
eukprot:5739753-Heterocapsa_arctica.AAC.1